MFSINSNFFVLGRSLSPYLSLALAGVLAGVLISLIICNKKNIRRNFVYRMTLTVMFIGFISEVFVNKIPTFILSFGYILGLLIATFSFALIARLFKKDVRDCCEIGLIAVNTFMIFSKLGCFFSGCCHGLPYDGIFSVTYHNNSPALIKDVPLFPIQLAEVLVRAVVLTIMLLFYYRDLFKKYRLPLYFFLMGNCYFWGMFFWYYPIQSVNQNGINYILIFNILFSTGTLSCILLQLRLSFIKLKINF